MGQFRWEFRVHDFIPSTSGNNQYFWGFGPSGAGVTPPSVTLAANGSADVTVSCPAPANAPATASIQGGTTYAPYEITLTGRAGALVSQTASPMTMTVRPWAYQSTPSVTPANPAATVDVAVPFTMSAIWNSNELSSSVDVLFQDPSISPGVISGACMVRLSGGGAYSCETDHRFLAETDQRSCGKPIKES